MAEPDGDRAGSVATSESSGPESFLEGRLANIAVSLPRVTRTGDCSGEDESCLAEEVTGALRVLRRVPGERRLVGKAWLVWTSSLP